MNPYSAWAILVFCARAKGIALAQVDVTMGSQTEAETESPDNTAEMTPLLDSPAIYNAPTNMTFPLMMMMPSVNSEPRPLMNTVSQPIVHSIPLTNSPPQAGTPDAASLANFLSSNTIVGLAIDPYIRNSAAYITENQLRALISSLSGVITNPIDVRGLLGTGLNILYSTLGLINNMINEYVYSSAVLENVRMNLRAVVVGNGDVQRLLQSVESIESSLLRDLVQKGSLALVMGAMMMPLPVS